MGNFYGGKPGAPFVLKASFSSIDAMITEFGKPNYTDVWFNEYCIIDTENKSDKDNGKIYRRVPKYLNKDYAEYVGQIVGPAGDTPRIVLSDLDSVTSLMSQAESDDFKKLVWSSETGEPTNDTESFGSFSGLDKKIFVPSSWIEDGETKYCKDVLLNYCNLKENDVTNSYIGLQIPYPTFSFSPSEEPISLDDYSDWKKDNSPLQKEDSNCQFLYNVTVPILKGEQGEQGVSVTSIDLLEDSGTITATLSSDETPMTVGQINYIQKMFIEEKTYNLYVLFVNQQYVNENFNNLDLENISYPYKTERTKDGTPISGTEDGVLWVNYGPVKTDKSLLVYRDITTACGEVLPLVFLNDEDNNDLIEESNGRVVTYTKEGVSEFFAYDYAQETWYSLGTLSVVPKVNVTLKDRGEGHLFFSTTVSDSE